MLTVSSANDRASLGFGFVGRELVARVLRCVMTVTGPKVPRAFLRLGASACLYRGVRRGFLHVLFAAMRGENASLRHWLAEIPSGLPQGSSVAASAHNAFLRSQSDSDVARVVDAHKQATTSSRRGRDDSRWCWLTSCAK